MYEEYHYNKYWTNHCEHPENTYVCSYETIELSRCGKEKYYIQQIDMYVYKDETMGTEVCLRYGNEGHEYMSCGNISYVCWSKQEVKKKAIRLLKELGDITWIRRTK